MKISVRARKGRYNLLDPSQESISVHIVIGKRSVSVGMHEDYWLDINHWDEYVPLVLENWIKRVLYSSNLHDAKVMLRWAKTEAGQVALHNAYVYDRRKEISAKIIRLLEQVERLATEMGSLKYDTGE